MKEGVLLSKKRPSYTKDSKTSLTHYSIYMKTRDSSFLQTYSFSLSLHLSSPLSLSPLPLSLSFFCIQWEQCEPFVEWSTNNDNVPLDSIHIPLLSQPNISTVQKGEERKLCQMYSNAWRFFLLIVM